VVAKKSGPAGVVPAGRWRFYTETVLERQV
jgi:hypothetical protein